MKDIYNDNTYLQKNPDWHSSDAPFKVNEVLKLLSEYPISINSICDIGCGTGEILVQLAKNLSPNIKMIGIDISLDAISIAKAKETTQLHFECIDVTEKEDDFDVLLVMDVIEHLPNYFQFLENIRLKGRYTIFHIPLDMCLWSLMREQMLIESKDRVGHIHNFTEDFIKSILSDYGFSIKAQRYTPPGFEVKNIKQKITNTIRKMLFLVNKNIASKIMGGYSILLLTENPDKS